jgi:chromosome segregation ATPase
MAAPWVQAPGGSGNVTPSRLQQMRTTSTLSPAKTVTKSISSPHLNHAAQAAQERRESDAMNTIPDPRSPTPQMHLSRNNSTDSNMHPDLSQEVATLSTKLINAINHQTTLDDNLQHTRHELDAAREKLARLEQQVKVHEAKVAMGLLVDKVVYEKMEKQLSSDLEEERRRRVEAEKAKRKTDNEVETLTAALFEEANVVSLHARSSRYYANRCRWSLPRVKRLKPPRSATSS